MMRPMPGNRMQSRFRRRWLAAFLLCLIVVLTLTHIPRDALPRMLQRSMLDKGEHVVAYGMVAMLFLLSLANPMRPVLAAAGLAALAGIGILDETTQPLVNRIASIWDYAADLVGIAVACTIFLVMKRLKFDTAPS